MKHYDYSRGLKAPYQLQVIRSPKGKLLWAFAQPVGLSYFVVYFLLFIFFLLVGQLVTIPVVWGFNANLIVLFYVPHKMADWYAETEVDGKKGIVYLKDVFSFLKEFVVDSRCIYRFERVEELDEIQFKR